MQLYVCKKLVKAQFHYAIAGSELAPNMFGASSELASVLSVMESGREPASSC